MLTQSTKPTKNFWTGEMKKQALAAFRSGKKTIVLRGIKFKLSKDVNKVKKDIDGVTREFTEEWLIVRPVDGSLVPMASLELTYNSRTNR